MHSQISQTQYIVWFSVMVGQLIVAIRAWHCRSHAVAVYLTWSLSDFIILSLVAKLGSAKAYYVAYCIGIPVDYAAQIFLLVSLFAAVRTTGIPGKNHALYFQVIVCIVAGVAIFMLPFSLQNITHPQWRWALGIDKVFYSWLCFMLILAPIYAWIVDAAKDLQLTLNYVGLAIFAAVNAGAIDIVIKSHLARAEQLLFVPDIAYFFSLVLWFISCHFKPASHQWDPAQTEALKAALRSKRSHPNALSRLERSLLP